LNSLRTTRAIRFVRNYVVYISGLSSERNYSVRVNPSSKDTSFSSSSTTARRLTSHSNPNPNANSSSTIPTLPLIRWHVLEILTVLRNLEERYRPTLSDGWDSNKVSRFATAADKARLLAASPSALLIPPTTLRRAKVTGTGSARLTSPSQGEERQKEQEAAKTLNPMHPSHSP
jgi:hypothetical protein